MKTLSEAVAAVQGQPDFWEANIALSDEIISDPKILLCLFLIASCNETTATKLMKAICLGVAVGIEMEKA